MADSDLDLNRKRFRDHDLYPLIVCIGVTAICAAVMWLAVTRLI